MMLAPRYAFAQVAINPSPAIPTTGSPPLDTGIGVTIALFAGTILKTLFDRGLQVFEQKDQSEAALTTALINDIRTTNQTLVAVLPEMKIAVQQTSEAVREVRSAVDRISSAYNSEIQQIRRANMEAIVEMRQQQAVILKRLDQLQEVR